MERIKLFDRIADGRASRRDVMKAMSLAGLASATTPFWSRGAHAGDELTYFTWSGYDIPEFHPAYIEKYGSSPQMPVFGEDEEAMLDTVLSTVVGEDNYPGDSTTAASWPGMGPGTRGVLNAMSPKHFNVADALVALPSKPPVVWVHGSLDAIVGDATLFDFAQLGKLGLVPGWPGEEECPPQPMVAQTRAVLDRYAGAGGSFTEVLLDGCGHSPHIERPAQFLDALLALIARSR